MKSEVTKCNNLYISWEFATKHNIKEKNKTQEMKRIPVWKVGDHLERYCKKGTIYKLSDKNI